MALTLRRAEGESVRLRVDVNEAVRQGANFLDITVAFTEIHGGRARLAIAADKDAVHIVRSELLESHREKIKTSPVFVSHVSQ